MWRAVAACVAVVGLVLQTVAGEPRIDSAAISIASEGAIGNSDTLAAGVANVAAFAAAFSASRSVACPAGQTFYVASTITIPTAAHALSGACTIVAGVAFPAERPVIEAVRNADLSVKDVKVVADIARFPGTVGLHFLDQTRLVLAGITATASFGIFDEGSTETLMTRPVVTDYGRIGILAVNEVGVVIDEPEVHARSAATTVGHCIQIGGLSRFGRVSDGWVYGCGYGFGVSIAGTSTGVSSDMTVRGMHTFGTRAEGINFTNVIGFAAIGNVETFGRESTDFGLSVTSDNDFPLSSGSGVILDNRIEGSCKAGIALAAKVTAITVTDNQIIDAGACIGRSASLTAAVDAKGIMTVSAVASGRIGWFDTVRGRGIPPGAAIQPFGSDGTTGSGGTGTYKLDKAPTTPFASEAVASRFSDPDHSRFGILVYGIADKNFVGTNVVSDRNVPPHLAYAEGELSHAGTPSDNIYRPAVTDGVEANALIIGRGSKLIEATRRH